MSYPTVFPAQNGLEIAIIGMSGRFPGAKNVEEFWQNIQNGVESISFFTDAELVEQAINSALLNNPDYVKAGAVLEDIELFDADFFGFSPREAEITDPQHRLFLECAWSALENTGYNSEKYEGAIGVFGGTSLNHYMLNLYSKANFIDSLDRHQLAIGSDKDFLTTRISYKLNLKGPSYTVQTACSTSLVAVHLACRSLLGGECDIALAGGVSISASRKSGYFYKQGGIASPDGHCRAFDANANGTVGGEGVAIVVLKRLEDAVKDGDTIHALIKGSAINNDGSNKVSYTAPSIDSQAKVIKTAIALAEVEPETITYIEAHGTGTSLGDPIEIAALTQAFNSDKQGFCAIGSVKTNIGHLDAAAGVVGLIKTVLALKHKQIPPSLHFQQPNPKIDFAKSPFYVNTCLSEWKTNGSPRRAGVSSFGIGGTNAHVVLEEAPVAEQGSGKLEEHGRNCQLLVISAKTDSALETATANLVNHLQRYPKLNLADVAYTLAVGRRAFDHRRILVCQNLNDAVQALHSLDPQEIFTHSQEPCNYPVIFMFSPQGAQYVNMTRELYESEPTFATHVDNCCELLKPHIELDLRSVLYPTQAEIETATQLLTQTYITQPALFVIEYALAQLWMEWGVRPAAMIGHSIGEYVAATIAGVFSLSDALAIVALRGQLMQELPPGAMLSVQLSEAQVQPLLGEELSLAACNSPSVCVVSGTFEAVDKLQQQLQDKGISCRRLHTSHAFHSQMMEPIVSEFTEYLSRINLNSPQISFVSNVSGTWITAAEVTDPQYWAKHLRQPVRFSAGLTELLKTYQPICLEVGPGRTLTSLAKQHQTENLVALSSIRHPQEQQSDVSFLLNSLGQLWLLGVPVNWSGFYIHDRRYRLPLPTYPFERQRYWIEANFSPTPQTPSLELLEKKPDIADWFYIPVWNEAIAPDFEQHEQLAEQSYWLLFLDRYGVATEIAKRLEKQGHDVITVEIGERFTQLGKGAYTINPQRREDYDRLMQALGDRLFTPQKIVHFWSLTPNNTLDVVSFETSQQLGFYSLLFLTQVLGKHNITEPVQLKIVTSNIHDITGDERLCPEKATVLGPCKVIPQEYPNINCCSIDIVIPAEQTLLPQRLITQLLTELTAMATTDVVAYRGKRRWIQTYKAVRLNAALTQKAKLRNQGVYLITGGLGSIGLTLGEYLAQKVQAKLILIGRSPLPERQQWEEWLTTHDEGDRISRKLKKIQALEALGAEVLVINADVANEEQMQKAIAKATECFGEIHGVIHAAAHPTSPTDIIQENSPAECELQFQPKVYGLYILEKLFQGKELDFCIFMSSLASVLGGLGFIAYAAANLFMDVFARKHNQTKSSSWMSVNWDAWQPEENKTEAAMGATLSNLAITANEGLTAFERMLAINELPQVVVSTGSLQARMHQWLKQESSLQVSPVDLGLHHPRPNLRNTYVPPRNEVEQTIANIWQQLLGIAQIGIHDNFFELGGDSLLATQVISQLRKAFRVELSIRRLFENPTVADQTFFIQHSQGETENNICAIARTEQENIQQILANLDQISNSEVDILLNQMLAAEDMSL